VAADHGQPRRARGRTDMGDRVTVSSMTVEARTGGLVFPEMLDGKGEMAAGPQCAAGRRQDRRKIAKIAEHVRRGDQVELLPGLFEISRQISGRERIVAAA